MKHNKVRCACNNNNEDDHRRLLFIDHPGSRETAASARVLGMVPLQPVPGSCSPHPPPPQAFTPRSPPVPTILTPLSGEKWAVL